MSKQYEEQLPYEQVVATFVKACGLRRSELEHLCVQDFYRRPHSSRYYTQWAHVNADGDIPEHEVPFIPDHEWTIAYLVKDRDPDDNVFSHLPDLDYESLRESYAWNYFMDQYEILGTWRGLRSPHEMGQDVKHVLGLRRLDKTRQAWMRWACRDWKRQFEE